MGKAEIIGEIGEGLYTVTVIHDKTQAEVMHTSISAAIDRVNAKLAVEFDADAVAFLTLRLVELSKQLDNLAALVDADYATSAWCADYTTGLTGAVGTIEAAAEYKNGFNIKPAYTSATFDKATDGQATPMMTMHIADAMRNFAIMPAIQKWRPTYRYATLSNLDVAGNTCTVTLDPVSSSIDNLNVNHAIVFDDVAIDYMSCDGQAFENGDAVIVRYTPFDSASAPVVIGFKDHPRSCGYVLKLNSINGVTLPSAPNTYKLRITQPIEQEIIHSVKGTYMEDFTVIGEGDCDDAGVAEVTINPGIIVDPNYPLNVQIYNGSKWTYFTTDIKGAVPNFGIIWPSTNVLYPYPTGDLSGYDYLVDTVSWLHVDIDLRTETQVTFSDADSVSHQGYLIDPVDIQIIRHSYTTGDYTDLECVGYYPINQTFYDDRIINVIEDVNEMPDGDEILYQTISAPLAAGRACPDDPPITCDCGGTLSSATSKIVGTLSYLGSPGYTVPWVMVDGTPVIFTDRIGSTRDFTATTRILDGDWDMFTYYLWTDVVHGDDGYTCYDGESTAPCGYSEGYVWETYKANRWDAVDIDAGTI